MDYFLGYISFLLWHREVLPVVTGLSEAPYSSILYIIENNCVKLLYFIIIIGGVGLSP
jgi:hypothetical protein